jgi:hypothetical protein
MPFIFITRKNNHFGMHSRGIVRIPLIPLIIQHMTTRYEYREMAQILGHSRIPSPDLEEDKE